MDRAALDVALTRGLPCGGWCPRTRSAEDGPIDPRYPLQQTTDEDPAVRTRLNVRDSHGTLIISRGVPTGGTRLAEQTARALGRPVLHVDPDEGSITAATRRLQAWVDRSDIAILNVAGPRESEQPGIGAYAAALLDQLLGRGHDRGPSPL